MLRGQFSCLLLYIFLQNPPSFSSSNLQPARWRRAPHRAQRAPPVGRAMHEGRPGGRAPRAPHLPFEAPEGRVEGAVSRRHHGVHVEVERGAAAVLSRAQRAQRPAHGDDCACATGPRPFAQIPLLVHAARLSRRRRHLGLE